MVVVPGMIPRTVPVDEIVATRVSVEPHTPPLNASVKLIVVLIHNVDAPLIAGGTGFTVTTAIAGQPVPATV